MLAGFFCVIVLALAFAALRLRARDATLFEPSGAVAFSSRVERRRAWLGALAVFAATLVPLLFLMPWVSGHRATFHGDDMTHARIAADIARQGLPHDWIESYMGGFPFGHHYPPATWLVVALFIKLGFTPVQAANIAGALAILATPLAFYAGALRCGARIGSSLAGALVIAWVSPYSSFVGGFDVFFMGGLLSQAIGTPCCILLAASLARGGPRAAVAFAGLAMMTHPQLAIVTFIVMVPAVAITLHRGSALRVVRASLATVVVGASLYIFGFRLQIPFGWPPNGEWRRYGFGADRLAWWFVDGDLLDLGRSTPILTAIGAACVFALALRAVRRPVPRAALLAALIVIAGSVSGRSLGSAGQPWVTLLSFLQPLRMLALIPIATGALFVVALETGAAPLASAFSKVTARPYIWCAKALDHLGFGIAALLCVFALPSRVDDAKKLDARLATTAAEPCGPQTPRGYTHDAIRSWLAELAPDRTSYEPTDNSPWNACGQGDAMELAVSGPIGVTGGAGAHVGVHWVAYRQIKPDAAGSAARAEHLGVRYLLRFSPDPSKRKTPDGWRVLHEDKEIDLLENTAASTRLVGAGCVREVWRGGNESLRDKLEHELVDDAMMNKLISPATFVELVIDRDPNAPVIVSEEPPGECDATGAKIIEPASEQRAPGKIEATISSSAPVDVVVRVSAFRSWTVKVDGVATPARLVAPGFLAVRVPSGSHAILATSGFGAHWPLLFGIPLFAALCFFDEARRALTAWRKRRARAT